MDPRLQEMLDHHEIRKLLAIYCHGCDRADVVRMASVYGDDSWDDHGRYKCSGPEFAEMITLEVRDTTSMCSHQLGQSLISVNGDEAGAETYFIASIGRPGEDGVERLCQMGGRYVDTLRRENGEWKIKTRICIREWSIIHRVEQDFLRGVAFVEGQRSNDDPAAAVLGLEHSGMPQPV